MLHYLKEGIIMLQYLQEASNVLQYLWEGTIITGLRSIFTKEGSGIVQWGSMFLKFGNCIFAQSNVNCLQVCVYNTVFGFKTTSETVIVDTGYLKTFELTEIYQLLFCMEIFLVFTCLDIAGIHFLFHKDCGEAFQCINLEK